MKGEKLYDRLVQFSERLDQYLARVIAASYKDPDLVCNPVTSRVPDATSLLFRVVQGGGEADQAPSRMRQFAKVLTFFVKNTGYFIVMLVHALVFRLSHLRFSPAPGNRTGDLIVISTFTMIDRIYPAGRFVDGYFGDLYEILASRKHPHVVLCFLFGDRPWRLIRRLKTYNILAKDPRRFVTEFELLTPWDWLELLGFIFRYPFKVLGLLHRQFGDYDPAFRHELVATLDLVQCQNYLRYLVGRRLNRLTSGKIKVLSWYENQVTDKLLFMGIRDAGINALIYGCQFFIKCPLYANLNPLAAEGEYGALPDVILTSGRPERHEQGQVVFKQGISPRYNYLFTATQIEEKVRRTDRLLVLLTYDIEESRKVIDLVAQYQACNPGKAVSIKLHPNHMLGRPFSYPDDWQTVEESVAELCGQVELVVTSGSSAALEAAVLGCSVVIVGNDNKLTINVMPELGRRQVWDLVFDLAGLEKALDALSLQRRDHLEDIKAFARRYLEMFFTEATEERYVRLFDL